MASDSLFGHMVATRFGAQAENLATEALTYVLAASPTARSALIATARTTGAQLPADLFFRTQVVGSDQSIPDVVGVDTDGQERLILEAKFWAGLTGRQPVDYLTRLLGKHGVLLFVAPSLRLTSLWPELLRRCIAAGLGIEPSQDYADGFPRARVDHTRVLALISWRGLLDALSLALNAASEIRARENVEQLRGLCDAMDEQAFLPLQPEELAAVSPGRLLQFFSLIDDLAALSLKSWCNRERLAGVSRPTMYGKYQSLNRSTVGVFIHTDLRKWARERETPFWLRVTGPGWKATPRLREVLVPLEREIPSRVLVDPDWPDSSFSIPLYPPLGVERDAVLHELFRQIENIYEIVDVLCPSDEADKVAIPTEPVEQAETAVVDDQAPSYASTSGTNQQL